MKQLNQAWTWGVVEIIPDVEGLRTCCGDGGIPLCDLDAFLNPPANRAFPRTKLNELQRSLSGFPNESTGFSHVPARIYALAKELNIDSKDLVDLVKKVGITGKGSALASLTDEEITIVI